MKIADALNVNPAWLQFGEPYANSVWPTEVPKEIEATESPEFTNWMGLVDYLVASATRDQLADAARLLALNVAHYQNIYGETPLENFVQLLELQEIDGRTTRLVATGMQNLVSVLGLVTIQDDAANDPSH
jgi:hypothetical protein